MNDPSTERFLLGLCASPQGLQSSFLANTECRGAAGQQLDFIETPHGTGPHFQEILSVCHGFFFFLFLSSTEAAAA